MVWNKRVGVGVGVRVSKLRGSYGQTCLQCPLRIWEGGLPEQAALMLMVYPTSASCARVGDPAGNWYSAVLPWLSFVSVTVLDASPVLQTVPQRCDPSVKV